MNMNRNVWEGWTPKDFIDELEPLFDMIMKGKSWQKPFTNKKEAVHWLKDNQPYYKRQIPEVNKYFCEKYALKQNKIQVNNRYAVFNLNTRRHTCLAVDTI